MNHRPIWPAGPLLASCLLFAGPADAQTATTAGAVATPEPTQQHISVEWQVAGDDDLDGRVAVRFRALGATNWREAMPLRRVPAGANSGFTWSSRHSGSLFGLSPQTTYEIELTLVDPDGGGAQRTVQATTRAVPAPFTGGTLRPATPATLASVLAAAMPGDIVELGAGDYPGFSVPRDGSVGRPLTLRGSAGAAINGELALFSRRHVILQGLTVNGRIRFNGSNDIAIIGCTVNAQAAVGAGDGIVTYTRSERAYIADNVVTGTSAWTEAGFGVNGSNRGEGILVAGPGHVVRGNRVSAFRDGISFLEESGAVDQYSIDVLDNEISESLDDGIEADFCAHNCRVVGNRLTNSFIAFSAQPSLGGPTYFVRNAAYNVVHVPFKLYRSSVGDVILHNTVVKTGDAFNAYPGTAINQLYARNNLMIGGEPGTYAGFSSGSGRVMDLRNVVTSTASLDYNGYGTTRADFRGVLGAASFTSIAELRTLAGEPNSVQVGMSVFAAGTTFPQNPLLAYTPVALTPVAGSAAIDRGVRIPNINDGFGGTAPDLGAFEVTAPPIAGDLLYRSGFEATP